MINPLLGSLTVLSGTHGEALAAAPDEASVIHVQSPSTGARVLMCSHAIDVAANDQVSPRVSAAADARCLSTRP